MVASGIGLIRARMAQERFLATTRYNTCVVVYCRAEDEMKLYVKRLAHLTWWHVVGLRLLSRATRVPAAELTRQAVDMVLQREGA